MRSGGRTITFAKRLAVVAALGVLVAACTVDGTTVGAAQNGVDATVAPAETAPAPSTPPVEPSPAETPSRGERVQTEPAASPADPGDPPPDYEPTWLRVNGLGVHDFGTTDTAVLATVEAVFGPALESSENSECGAGPMTIVSFDDFSVNFQSGEFIGWFYRSSEPALTTPSGVAPGIDEPSLIDVYDGVDIFEESLGKEFFFEVPAGFMGGFFEDDSATVTAMFAGINCFFR